MITFLCAADNRTQMRRYLRDWGQPLRAHLRQVSYERAPAPADLPDGTYLFTDVDRLDARTGPVALAIHAELAARGDRVRILNVPGAALPRFELLRALHARGWNDFNIHLPDAPRTGMRFPVFLRSSRQHTGAASGLLPDAAALDQALARLRRDPKAPDDPVVVEYIDTGHEGLYRKYSAFRAGDTIVAHHVMFDRDWEVKGPSLAEPAMLAEERAFQEANPHQARLREVFELARIDYGRIDYAMAGERMQVWEINTNPTLLYPRRRYAPAQLPAKYWFAERMNAALLALDDKSGPRRPWWRLFSGG